MTSMRAKSYLCWLILYSHFPGQFHDSVVFFKLDRYRETCQVLLFGTICGKQRIQEKQIIFFNVFNNKKKKIENYR